MDTRSFLIVILTAAGASRVLNGHEGMTFVVDRYNPPTTVNIDGKGHQAIGVQCHVRDYRFPQDAKPFQTWTLGEGDFVRLPPERDATRPERFDHKYERGAFGVCQRCGHEKH